MNRFNICKETEYKNKSV